MSLLATSFSVRHAADMHRMAEGAFTELFLADITPEEHDNAEYWMNLDGTEAVLALKLRSIAETGLFSLPLPPSAAQSLSQWLLAHFGVLRVHFRHGARTRDRALTGSP
jgi:hypothetical protein